MPNVHFGKMIKEELRHQNRSIAWFAEQMHCDRSNMYKLLGRPNHDSDFIIRASRLLRHDFLLDASIELNLFMVGK